MSHTNSSTPGSSLPLNARAKPPHIRLNSQPDNILSMISDSSDGPRPGSSQVLMGGRDPNRERPRRPPLNISMYQQPPRAGESAELLLPPRRTRPRRFRDDPDSPLQSPVSPTLSSLSRRTSWSSDSAGSRDSHMGLGPFISPFDDSRPPSRTGSDDDNVNTQTVSEKYNITPSAGLLLFPEDVEKDDYLHNPDPNDNDRDECNMLTRRGIVNLGGLGLITLGILVLFIGYPVLTFVQRLTGPIQNVCAKDPMCIDVGKIPLLKNVRTGLIDPDTPKSAMSRKTRNGKKQTLVFSDEFNRDGRTFYEGDDPYFTAVDIWYGVTADLEWYDPDAVTTSDGTLNLRFDAFQNHNLNYRSGMVQSWNKMCFKGGYMEASISLPGRGDTMGFWPGFWAMGNLGRPGYPATTDGMWPYSYDNVCDAGITANQSDASGLSYLPGMKLPACTCKGEDHPTPGKSRSAPEIDAIEASVAFLGPGSTNGVGLASQSIQCAPFDVFWRPDYDFVELYDRSLTTMNPYQGGVFQQAISGVTNLNNQWYEGNQYQTYSFEYEPGDDGYVTWYVGKDATWTLDARAMGPNGNIGQRVIPVEPMAMIMNFGMSNGFAQLNLTGLGPLMPATMRFDYVRIYQDEDEPLVGCDPPGYPTTDYIAAHPEAYNNPNLTLWSETPYAWPKNSLVHDCKAQNYDGP